MARQGLNVVLMSRSREKLQKAADEISKILENLATMFCWSRVPPEETYNKEVLVIPVDFSSDKDIYDDLSNQLQGLDIAVLGTLLDFLKCMGSGVWSFLFLPLIVNNVGLYYGLPDVVGNVTPQVKI